MALRADQWLMIGVGLAGAYFVYRLAQPYQPPEVEPAYLPGTDPPPPGTFGTLNWLGRAPAGPGASALSTGGWYGGRADGARPEAVLTELSNLGFTNIRIYDRVAAERADAVSSIAFNASRPDSLFFTALWPRASTVRAMPPWIVLIYPTVRRLRGPA